MTYKKLLIVDPDLRSMQGHNYEYDNSIIKSATEIGIDCSLLASNSAKSLFPINEKFNFVFQENHKLFKFSLGYIIDSILKILISNFRFYSAFGAWKNKNIHFFKSDSCVFIPNINIYFSFGFVLSLIFSKNKSNYVLLFRFEEPEIYLKLIGFLINRFSKRNNVRFVTDSSLLCGYYEKLMGVKFETLPIPHTNSDKKSENRIPNTKLRFSYLGNARFDKGFDLLINTIKKNINEIKTNQIEFHIQCKIDGSSGEICTQSANELKNLAIANSECLKVYESTLSGKEYYELLNLSDVIIIPYRESLYKYRTSGPFTEAISNQKIVIVPENTWMSHELLKLNLAGVTFKSENTESLFNSFKIIPENIDFHKTKSKETYQNWNNFHNPRNFIKKLLLIN